MASLTHRLDEIQALPPDARIEPLLRIAQDLVEAEKTSTNGVASRATLALASLLETGVGTGKQRLQVGELLGRLGDPRLRRPEDPEYWAEVPVEDGTTVQVGRFHVTTAEFLEWVRSGGYDDDQWWSSQGLEWRNSTEHRWDGLAKDPSVAHLLIPNQPVAGPTWWEADAYAKAHGARLLTTAEHRWIMRGEENRPYPWGAPFGDGNANTREEALGRPCAVGLYLADRTPEGVCDLAGNMGEWLADEAGSRRVIHPGSWARPSMASWAKALEIIEPEARSADLSFRLAR